MVFSSVIFLFLFLPLVLVLHSFAGTRARNTLLLVASLIFYAWGEGVYLLVMLYCIASSWFFGRLIDRAPPGPRRKKRLLIAIFSNLLPLFYFKYATFAAGNVLLAGSFVGISFSVPQDIVLPIGISFFTFQSLSYLIDVYRRDCDAQHSVLNLGLYISLFPQLIAGPIVRYRDINLQLTDRRISASLMASGIERFTYGLGKKVLIANPLGLVADHLFSLPPDEIGFAAAWLGIICYALQIYFDFSGYSDMAIGLGRMLGFRFLENFNFPYIARSIREFWRRWHISLSNWFRDYVYIPLGGNRGAYWRVARNLLVVFLLCGLWHGAAWNFIFWGLIHGLFLTAERGRFGRLIDAMPGLLQHLYVLIVVLFAWVFFRAEGISHGFQYAAQMLLPNGEWMLPPLVQISLDRQFYFALIAGLIFSAPIFPTVRKQLIDAVAPSVAMSAMVLVGRQALVTGILLIAVFDVVSGAYNPFIYFRF